MSKRIQTKLEFRLTLEYLNNGDVVATIFENDRTITSQLGNDSQHATEKAWQRFDNWLRLEEENIRMGLHR